MNFGQKTNRLFRIVFFIFALLIIIISTVYSNSLVNKMAREERARIELWADAVSIFASQDSRDNCNYSLAFNVIEGNKSIPVVLLDNKGDTINCNNINFKGLSSKAIDRKINKIVSKGNYIEVPIDKSVSQYVYYDDSPQLKQLMFFPVIELIVMFVFLIMTILAIFASKRAEQERLWVGLSKETAHQLGTPISSLIAWLEYFKIKNIDKSVIDEVSKDTDRLQVIADRFSKIGSKVEPVPVDLGPVILKVTDYMKTRTSENIQFKTNIPDGNNIVLLNAPLFEWVIENLCKNAVDAIESGKGKITFEVFSVNGKVIIDVTDTGKGILKSNYKNIFKPGFTTKRRGWGLGLSLVKRIIKEYHKGKIFVKESELGKGTTFRIILNAA